MGLLENPSQMCLKHFIRQFYANKVEILNSGSEEITKTFWYYESIIDFWKSDLSKKKQ